MLYRLSYSLEDNPTSARAPGNTHQEIVEMHQSTGLTASIGLALILGGTDLWAAPPANRSAAPTERAVVVSQADDGSILLSGSDAAIRGTTLRWEPEEKKRTLGFWTKASDAAEWRFAVRTPGTFDVEVLQGCGTGQGGSEMAIEIDEAQPTSSRVAFTVEDTGGFQAFRQRTVGRVTIGETGDHTLRVQPKTIAKAAACDIRQIQLVPVTQ